MSQDILRGGIIGCGVVANEGHLPAWRAARNAQIVAVCDSNVESASKTARRWGISGVYEDLSQMIRNQKINFIDICTPPQTHFQIASQALDAGLHILIEKPVMPSLKEAEEIVRISNKAGTKLCVVHHALFYRVFNIAQSMIDSGSIGDLTSVDIDVRIPRTKLGKQNHWYHNMPGGVLGEHAPHPVYLLQAILGNPRSIKVIAGKCGRLDWVPLDELKVLVEGEKGIGAFSVSCNASVFSFTIDISGTRENIHLDLVTQTLTRIRPRSNRTYGLLLRHLDSNLQVSVSAMSVLKSSLLGQKWYRTGHRRLVQKFVESIQNNLESPVTALSGLENIKTLEQIWSQIKVSRA